MSANETDNSINPDWSIKGLNEIDRKNLFGFFGLLHAVDRRTNPHLYKDEDKDVDDIRVIKEKC